MRSRLLTVYACIVIVIAIIVNLSGCTVKTAAANLMDGIIPSNTIPVKAISDKSVVKANDFAVRLFRETNENGRNTLVSPLSVLSALAMTVNGAKGDTLTQMESVIGLDVSELNDFFIGYMRTLDDDLNTLSLANSIWFTSDERFTINRDFLQTNADYYSASIYKAPFDSTTLNDINSWVNDKTHGMIPSILEQLSADSVMCLVNALAFEAEWADIYTSDRVQNGIFTCSDGEEQNVEYMYSTEHAYIEDGNATGFIKYYKNYKYAFVAILPKEDVSIDNYLDSLTGEGLQKMLSSSQNAVVYTSLPKFETEYCIEMSDILSNMGMKAAFTANNSDFSGIGSIAGGNLYIDEVIHKTFISVGEQGTRAGAATAIDIKAGSAFNPDIKTVYLDRPFVYMLIDTETFIPFFLGTMLSIKK